MPDYTFRHATIADLRSNLHLWEPDRGLFTPAIWTRLTDLLEPLLETQRVRIGLVEERETGRARLLGGCSFVEPALMREAIATEGSTLINALFTMVAENRSPFLSLKQTAVANAAGQLIAFSFLGVPDIDYSAEPMSVEDGLLTTVLFQAYGFFYAGYQKIEAWYETLRPGVRQVFIQVGAPTEVRERTAHNGQPSWLFRQTLAEAQRNPGAAFVYQFLARPPRLGLTTPMQNVIENALLGHSDSEICQLLAIGEETLKKRWRAIYLQVQRAEPSLLQGAAPQMKRKLLVDALRHRLEEIRPYRKAFATPSPLGGVI